MWKVEVYKKTGLNEINIVDNVAILNESEHESLPALDILCAETLSYITVRATRNQIKDVDFLSLTDEETGDVYYYSVDSYMPTSKDVWHLYVTISGLLTIESMVGGIENIKFLDGMTNRHHVKKEDDVFGAYTEKDPLLIPSKELILENVSLFDDMICEDNTDSYEIVESMYDLPASGVGTNAKEYTSESGQYVTVPQAIPAVARSNSIMKNPEKEDLTNFITPGSLYHDYSKAEVQAGVQTVRSLGDEKGIWRSVRIPKAAVDSLTEDEVGHISVIIGAQKQENTGLKFEYAEVKNKRVLYGNLNSYVIVSTANGNMASYKPEDIYKDGDESPIVTMVADVRPEGKPFFRFSTFKGDDKNFFLNPVEGMEWANMPIAYYDSSGNWFSKLKYQAGNAMITDDYNTSKARNAAAIGQNIFSAISHGADQASDEYLRQNMAIPGNDDQVAMTLYNQQFQTQAGLLQYGINFAGSMVNAGMSASINKVSTERAYQHAAYNEMLSYIGNTVISAPDIQFPRSNSMRDYRGNGVYVYRYRYQEDDVRKLDKVLTMYGYHETKVLENSDFTGRAKFNYVSAFGVSIGGALPKWLREAAAEQLKSGVRVWHQLPDLAAYTDGSNV